MPRTGVRAITPEEAADKLGIFTWELKSMLHRAAADEFRRIADSVYAGYEVPENRIDRARRLQAAALACPEDDLDDGWKITTEHIDFAPIWSREQFEERARKEGWLVGDPVPEDLK